jgi:pimeloyl-ACP methyl ester carboxylesterase
MHMILVPGLWLDGSSWDAVVPLLEQAGHRTQAITLPGMESTDADRSKVSLSDHVDAVVRAVDATDPPVVLVGHSMGGGICHAAADARPDRVARVIYVASEPRGDGDAGGGFPEENGELPFPDWSFFDEEMVADLDDEARAAMRERTLPSPARVVSDPMRLSDDRRYDVPATIIACEYSSAKLREWTEQNQPGTEELGKLRNATYVDLPSGHWPQFSRPDQLARVILASVED